MQTNSDELFWQASSILAERLCYLNIEKYDNCRLINVIDYFCFHLSLSLYRLAMQKRISNLYQVKLVLNSMQWITLISVKIHFRKYFRCDNSLE